MQSLPIPTDNLYKFFAMFGLAILITAIMGSVLINSATNQKLLTYIEQIETIAANGESEAKKGTLEVYEKLIKVTINDKKFLTIGLGLFGGVGVLMLLHGFQRWYTYYQPKHDEILELTINKMRAEAEDSSQKPSNSD